MKEHNEHEADWLFRSHFERANHLDDRGFEQARPAYRAGHAAATNPANANRSFDEIETDLENGWLNVRTGDGEWASVRSFAKAGFELARNQGRIVDATPS